MDSTYQKTSTHQKPVSARHTTVSDSIPGLPIHTDGILCTRTPECGYAVRSAEFMKRRWREKHGWTPASGKGRPRIAARNTALQQVQQFSRMVEYQQAFEQGPGRHYIHVQGHRSPSPLCLRPRPTPS
ncbi:hypothetical protein N7530_010650 [Penicillium desertorum]|uniref:Uncharacterized protein n=1 Tax=Penicillium desertorum TaxID=1303715 RepID=A0A9W9WHU0_9EURO|nr:hypothetical protein N7530_010650 [Penicillium desertorum]